MKFDNVKDNRRRDLIIEMLRRSVCTVTFTKVNGEIRNMPCTLRDDIVPVTETKEATRERKKTNKENLSVWCTDKKEWRSFRLANVIEVLPSE